MLNKALVLRRLALIKYLYTIGIEQSKQTETVASFSILSLHDSIEMYLKLLAEYKDIKSENFKFLDYWTNIPTLTLKESMRNLNARRVNIKHKGLLPSKADIEISRVNATDFFEQNTSHHFGIDFHEISLISLVQYENVRQNLEESQKALDENNYERSVEMVAFAFDDLLQTYENSKSSIFGKSPFYFGKNLASISSSNQMGIKKSGDNSNRNLAEFVDNVKDSLVEIQKAMKIIGFGIDYKRYAKFKLLTPNILKLWGGKKQILKGRGNIKLTKNNCQYCIDFVLDNALKLQEFNFDINEIVEN